MTIWQIVLIKRKSVMDDPAYEDLKRELAEAKAALAERTWAAADRAHAEAALRESEAKYRTLFEAIDDGLVIGEMVREEDGRAIDFRYLEANPAMEKLVGWNPQEIAGRLVTELVSPEEARFWVDTLEELICTDGSKRLDHYQPSIAQWYRINATSLGANRIVSIYQNITAEKLSEVALRESEKRQAFLLRLSDVFAPLTVSADIEDVAARLLVEHLGANRAIYLEIEGSGESQVVVIRGQHARDVPRFPTRALYADYAKGFPNELLQAGRTLVVCDAATDPRLDEEVRNVWLGSNIVAAIAASLVKDGRIVGAFGLHSAVPRQWTATEIRLVEEAVARTWTAVEASRSEAALRESEERFAQFAKASSGGLWIRDAATLAMEYASPAIGTIYGIAPGAILGPVEKWAAMIVPDDRDVALEHLEQARLGKAVVHEFRIRRLSDGAFR